MKPNSQQVSRLRQLPRGAREVAFQRRDGSRLSRDVEPDRRAGLEVGLVVGPSGSGKTSIGKTIFGGDESIYSPEWPDDKPIVDANRWERL